MFPDHLVLHQGKSLAGVLEGGCCCPGHGVQELCVASRPLEKIVVLFEFQWSKL